MYCAQCGNKVGPENKFCAQCGGLININKEEQKSANASTIAPNPAKPAKIPLKKINYKKVAIIAGSAGGCAICYRNCYRHWKV